MTEILGEKERKINYFRISPTDSLERTCQNRGELENMLRMLLNKIRQGLSEPGYAMVRILSILLRNPTLTPCSRSILYSWKTWPPAFKKSFEFLYYNRVKGDVAEFGTFRGYTARIIAKLMQKMKMKGSLHLFDSFTGFPEISGVDSRSYEYKETVWSKGTLAIPSFEPEQIERCLQRILPKERLHLHKGFFQDTLKEKTFLHPLSLVHIDCDLYESARFVLDHLMRNDLLQDGSILMFDDYNCGKASPELGERKALADALAKFTRFSVSHFFYYGWGGACFIVHRKESL